MLNLLDAEVEQLFKNCLKDTVLVGIGNTLRSDDAIGPYIVNSLLPSEFYTVIDAGQNPENYIDSITKLNPRRIIFIDAADFSEKPGTVKILSKDLLPEVSVSTHAVPLRVVGEILASDNLSSEIVYIGVQIKNISFGETISQEVLHAGKKIVSLINKEKINA